MGLSRSTAVINCLICGYSLRNLREYRCPECGAPFGQKRSLSRAQRFLFLAATVAAVHLAVFCALWFYREQVWPAPRVDAIMRMLASPVYLFEKAITPDAFSGTRPDSLSVYVILAVNSGLWGLALAALYRFIRARFT